MTRVRLQTQNFGGCVKHHGLVGLPPRGMPLGRESLRAALLASLLTERDPRVDSHGWWYSCSARFSTRPVAPANPVIGQGDPAAIAATKRVAPAPAPSQSGHRPKYAPLPMGPGGANLTMCCCCCSSVGVLRWECTHAKIDLCPSQSIRADV